MNVELHCFIIEVHYVNSGQLWEDIMLWARPGLKAAIIVAWVRDVPKLLKRNVVDFVLFCKSGVQQFWPFVIGRVYQWIVRPLFKQATFDFNGGCFGNILRSVFWNNFPSLWLSRKRATLLRKLFFLGLKQEWVINFSSSCRRFSRKKVIMIM